MEHGDDNADEFESLLCPQQRPMDNRYSGNISESVLDTLRYIQQGNPQVETIFIDSDEDENEVVKKPVIQIHDMQTIKPARPSSQKEGQAPYQKEAQPPYQKEGQLQPVPFTVKQISASNFTTNFARNGNTIVLQDESNKTSAMRYLFIPNEVLPIIATAKGPISLNVPGIGPLLIPKPSEMLNHSGRPKQVFVQNKISNTVPTVKTPKPTVYDPLCDQKFPCWKNRRAVKRDLEGYSVYDRLGFYRAEEVRARMCAVRCEGLVKKFQVSLDQAKKKLAAFRSSKFNMKNIKLVEIDKIKKGKTKQISENKNKKLLKADALSPLQKKNLKTLISWKKRFKPDTDHINDLLLTKKVVILNQGMKRQGRKKKSILEKTNMVDEEETDSADEPILSDDDPFHHISDEEVRPQVVENVNRKKKRRGRPKKLLSEFVYFKNKKQIREVASSDKQVKRGRPRKVEITKPTDRIKRKPGRPRKVKRKIERGRIPSNKKLYVDVDPVKVSEEAVKKYKSYYNDSLKMPNKNLGQIKIIGNLKQFRNKMIATRPILVVNEENCAKMDLADLSETNNIVFPTSSSSEIPKSLMKFVNNKFNINFVKPDILCQYFSGMGKGN